MYKKIALIFITIAIVITSACKKGEDLYTDPTSPLKVTPQTLLTALEVNTFQNAEGDLARSASIFVQQTAGTADYLNVQNYDLTEGQYNNQWAGLYSGTMQDAKIIINEFGAQNPYYSGIAKILLAYNLGIATDAWGDVPYSEAFNAAGGVFAAKYDTQEQILNSIQTLCDEAISELGKEEGANLLIPGEDDLIYGGMPANWIKAAWTLKARYANRLSKKDPAGSATKALEYLSKGIASGSENLEAKHSTDANSQNQWGAFQNQRTGSIVANEIFIDILKSNDDPRLEYYFSPADTTGNYLGASITDEQINTDVSTTGSFFEEGDNYPLLTYQEAKFLEAEAKLRLGQDASGALNEAIKASVAYVTGGEDDGAGIAAFTQGTATLQAVMTEKWKASFGQIEPYNDYRRTGLPALTPRPSSAGALRTYIPMRFPTPQNERQQNPNAKVFELNVPVWWASN